MKMTHDYASMLSKMPTAFDKAVDDTVQAAQEIAGRNSVSGKFRDSITSLMVSGPAGAVTAVIGSPLVSARVKEKGGYSAGNPKLLLRLAGGEFRTADAVRIRATPAVTPAAAKFPELMTRRMREAAGG